MKIPLCKDQTRQTSYIENIMRKFHNRPYIQPRDATHRQRISTSSETGKIKKQETGGHCGASTRKSDKESEKPYTKVRKVKQNGEQ